MNNENQSLLDLLFNRWQAMSPAGKTLAGGTALIWLLWLFWLPIAQDLQQQPEQTFLPTISDSEAQLTEEIIETDEEVFLPAIAGED
ncbi:MAG: hypothetical protein AB8G95_19365 [Anaerolineae bacterium]